MIWQKPVKRTGLVEYMDGLLFLLGGSAAFEVVADAFVPAAGGREALIVVLVQSRAGWQKHKHGYLEPWMRRGVSRYEVVAPDEDSALDLEAACASLRRASGLFIGGGHTPTYQRLYASEPIRSVIGERYCQGIPIAGVSAGALIAPEICVLSAQEVGLTGLGLVKGLVVEPHFGEQSALPNLLEAMVQSKTQLGLGIDDSASAVFKRGVFRGVLGRDVYQVEMVDLTRRTYQVQACDLYLSPDDLR